MNWALVKDGIKDEVEDILLTGNPAIRDFDEVVALFRKAIFCLTRDKDLNGLSQVLPVALQDAFVEKIGQVGPLKILVDSIEPYLKKLYVIAGLGTEQQAKDRHFTFLPVLKALRINTALSSQTAANPYPQLEESMLPSYGGQPEYLEQICITYLTRNKVHLSPKWNKTEVLPRLSAVMTVYLYATYVFKSAIQALPDAHPETDVTANVNPSEKYLYYFISYGDTTNKIKNQIVNAYILQYLQKNGKVAIETLRKECNTYFHANMDTNYYQSLLMPLRDSGSVIYYKDEKAIELTAQELSRIATLQSSFDDDKDLFFLYLEDVCREFSLESKINDIFKQLRSFIESNYKSDIAEGLQKGQTVTKDEKQRYDEFIEFLKELTGDFNTAKDLFTRLIGLSKTSDFLLKICASGVFANISNPDRFDQYVRQHERVVYLDTQLVLFALCLDYGDDIEYDNIFYQTVEQLFDLFYRDQRIEARVSVNYLREAAFQLRLALMLIPFEEMGGESLSGNVFYQFYYYLKKNNKLYADDRSYEDFIYNFLHLKEADAYKHNYQQIITRNISDILYGFKCNIGTIEVPPSSQEAFNTVDDILKAEGGRPKSKYIIENDAKMLSYLCDPDQHITEPFFLTWDKHWVEYRKQYMESYARSQVISFHLFNPAKFINHNSLINLKINPQAITDDLLSLVESYHSSVNTQTIWDQVNKFTTIEYITPEQRRRRISSMVSIFRDEFNFTTDDIETRQKMDRMAVEFDDVTVKINDHFYNHSKYKLDDYGAALLNDGYFDKIVRIVVDASALKTDTNFLKLIDALVTQFKEEKEEKGEKE